jgi:hypothetical protein
MRNGNSNNNNNGGSNNNQQQRSSNNPGNPGQGNSRGGRNNRHRGNFRRNRGNGGGGGGQNNNRRVNLDDLLRKRENLIDQYLIARRKYYDMYYRVNDDQRRKMEYNFYNSVEQLRDFEARIPEEFKEAYQDWVNGNDPDFTYSNNRELEPQPLDTNLVDPNFRDFDPHVLETQKQANFKQDKEESLGSLEDYYHYKGVKPEPTKFKD